MNDKKYDYDEVKDISSYIKICSDIEKEFNDEIIVFRGETQDFGKTSCIPGLFRKDYLKNNRFFEKNLLDEMTANGIAKGNSYLEKAINAQHDGFPSRLLDVTYNCLIGLQFAVAPYYKYRETCDDDKDGVVYVYHFENSFCATGDGISDNYDEILKKESDWYDHHFLFSKNFKFIDHMRINERIKAQNGAFVLFQGDEPHQIPDYFYKTIKIPRQHKTELRYQLKKLFDIDNSTIYPEAYNLVQKISDRSLSVKEIDFSIYTELDFTLNYVNRYLDENLSILFDQKTNKIELIRKIEKELLLYSRAFDFFIRNIKHAKKEYNLKPFIDEYNTILSNYFTFIQRHKPSDVHVEELWRLFIKLEKEDE